MAAELGYQDTPILPGTPWHVHDGHRPQPRVVTPPTESSQPAPGSPPSDAVVLFDGADASRWVGKDGGACPWKVADGCMEVVPGSGSIFSAEAFGDVHLHVEWAAPTEITGDGQGRGNSGVFLMKRYEVQVLDCHGNQTYPDGTTGAIYGQLPPLVNACRAPGQWQVYDIYFFAPVFEGDKLARPAYLTVIHNGLPLHIHQPLAGPTRHKQLASYEPHEAAAPVELQDHKDLVRFRNIWARPIGAYDQG